MSTPSVGGRLADDSPPAARPARERLSPPVAFGAVSGTALALIAGILLLVRGSDLGVVFLVLGLIYLGWLAAVRAGSDDGKLLACLLIFLFCIAWAVISAAARHDYAYALSVGAYGMWALAAAHYVRAGASGRSFAFLLVGHVLAIADLALVGLSWQADTALALAAIVLALITLGSVAADSAKATGQAQAGAGPAAQGPPS